MKIVGEVTYEIYHNADDTYRVFEIKNEEGKRIKVAGVCPPQKMHSIVEIYGHFEDTTRGKTFKLDTINLQKPVTSSQIITFLSSGMVKGIRERTARRIYEKYGEDTLSVLSNPMELAQVGGIRLEKAKKISESYNEIVDRENVYLFFSQYGITNKMIQKIFDRYGQNAIAVVKRNPYQLIEEVRGIGFMKADEIALRLGIPWDSEFRISAGIKYVLECQAKSYSNTYVPAKVLYEQIYYTLEKGQKGDGMRLDREKVQGCLEGLVIKGDIFYFPKHPQKAYMLRELYYIEKRIARNLRVLINSQKKIQIDLDKEIQRYENVHKITFHENQKKAIQTAIQSGICIITGGPGVGKTTIIQCIIGILKNLKTNVALCAPTGRAAKRMEETTGEPAKTIHRLLDCRGGLEGDGGLFSRNEDFPLEEDAFIVDEMSMTDEYVFDALIRAIKPGSRLIIVGDKDQLQSVGVGNVLGDLIESNEIDTVYLTHIYRQKGGNKIAENASLINSGKMPNLNNEKGSKFNFIPITEARQAASIVKKLVFEDIPKTVEIEPENIQVMSPIKSGFAGVDSLNLEIKREFIRRSPEVFIREVRTQNGSFRVGDKVMQTVNNYKANILNAEELRLEERGVYNGDVGYVIEVNPDARTMKVEFIDGKIVLYKSEELNSLILAYAITIHKSQGSEFPIAIIVLPDSFGLTRSMIYTAVTRAKRSLVIVGEEEAIKKALQRQGKEKRYTFLKEFLTGEVV